MEKINISKIKKILIGICLLLIVALIIFVVTVDRKKDDPQKEKEEEIQEQEEKYSQHMSYDGVFSIEAPVSWKEVKEKNSLNKNAIIELENEDKNAFLVVVTNNKKDLKENFNTYKTNVFKQKESFYKTTITSYQDVTIDEHPAQDGVIYYTNSNNINTYIRSYAFETENYYGQIVIWTLASNEELVQKEFDKITTSLNEI